MAERRALFWATKHIPIFPSLLCWHCKASHIWKDVTPYLIPAKCFFLLQIPQRKKHHGRGSEKVNISEVKWVKSCVIRGIWFIYIYTYYTPCNKYIIKWGWKPQCYVAFQLAYITGMLLWENKLPSGFISPLNCEIHFDHQTYLTSLYKGQHNPACMTEMIYRVICIILRNITKRHLQSHFSMMFFSLYRHYF